PKFVDLSPLAPTGFSTKNATSGLYEMPFLDRMGFVFIICIIGMVIISLVDAAKGKETNGLEIDAKMFKTSNSFAIGAMLVIGVIVALYTIFW
ncbi:sodium transporter, partial [Mucilaginibacter sp. 5B2]|nr:sodium transporter [Mucilaginibacter sp. 5B2]